MLALYEPYLRLLRVAALIALISIPPGVEEFRIGSAFAVLMDEPAVITPLANTALVVAALDFSFVICLPDFLIRGPLGLA